MPTFLIDRYIDEVSQTGILISLSLGPVLLNLGPVSYPYPANRVSHHGQNSAKQCQNGDTVPSRLQLATELHQKDLRKVAVLLQIWGPENEAVSEADTFLALFLIVGFYVSAGSNKRRRVHIPVKRPCK